MALVARAASARPTRELDGAAEPAGRAACARLGVRPGGRGSASASSARRSWSSALLGDPQGGRRLRAARPGLSARAPGVHAGGRRGAVLLTAGAPAGAAGPLAARVAAARWTWRPERPRTRAGRPPASAGVRPENLAYVIYTSGSTGRPRGWRSRTAASSTLVALGDATTSAPAAATGVLAATLALLRRSRSSSCSCRCSTAARLVVLPREDALDAADAAGRAAARTRVNDARLPPALARSVVRDGPALRGLRAHGAASAGEAAARRAGRRACERRPARELLQPLRPDRGHDLRRPSAAAWRAGRTRRRRRSAGRSPTRAAYVLDRATCSRCRSASPASCCIGGAGLARGYLRPPGPDRRALRARSVRGDAPGARLYRTGDLARRRPDGDARVPRPHRPPGQDPRLPHRAGRDRGGARRAIPAVREAAVVVARGRAGRPPPGRLRGAGAATAGRAGELRRLPRERLPRVHGARRPSSSCDALPLTAERQGRPPRPAARRTRGRPRRRPLVRRRARRSRSCSPAIWARCSGVDRVGVDDDFFDLGGDSLLAIHVLVPRAASAASSCPPAALPAPDGRALAARASRPRRTRRPAADAAPSPWSPRRTARGRRPASRTPTRWPGSRPACSFHSELSPERGVYHDVSTLPPARRRSTPRPCEPRSPRWSRRHAVLRTRSTRRLQRAAAARPPRGGGCRSPSTDLRDLLPRASRRRIAGWLAEEPARPVRLAPAPLLRFHVHRRATSSVPVHAELPPRHPRRLERGVLLTELFRRYALLRRASGREAAGAVPLPRLRRAWSGAPRAAERRPAPYWRRPSSTARRRAGLPPPAAPAARLRGARAPADLCRRDRAGLGRLARREAVAAQERPPRRPSAGLGLLAGAAPTWSPAWCPTAGRRGRTASRLLGLFLNTLPLRAAPRRRTWSELAAGGLRGRARAAPPTAASRWPRCRPARQARRRAALRGDLQLHALPCLRGLPRRGPRRPRGARRQRHRGDQLPARRQLPPRAAGRGCASGSTTTTAASIATADRGDRPPAICAPSTALAARPGRRATTTCRCSPPAERAADAAASGTAPASAATPAAAACTSCSPPRRRARRRRRRSTGRRAHV